jgi:hypothetical protein
MREITITVEDPSALLAPGAFGPGALGHWESASAATGPWATGGSFPITTATTYTVWDGDGTAATWYRVRYSDSGNSTFGDWSDAGSSSLLVSLADVRAVIPTRLTDAQLAPIIAREEAMLARQITELAGPRTQLYYIGDPAAMGLWWDSAVWAPGTRIWVLSDRMGPLGLLRPTDAVAVTDNGVAVSAGDLRLLRQGTLVERAAGGWRGPLVEITYTPNDALEVIRVVIELCRLTMTETGYQSETIGGYRYVKHLRPAPGQVDPRKELIRSLMTHLTKGTMQVRTSSEDDRIGAVS